MLIGLTALLLTPASAEPYFSGVWGRNTLDYLAPDSGPGPVANVAGRPDMTIGDDKNPILKPWAAEIVRKMGEVSRTGDAFPTAHNQCWPEPPPYILGNRELQMVQTSDRVLLIYSHGPQIRTVRLNDTHPEHVTLSWYGDSVGHFEGDTLVIDTVGIAVKPLSTVDRYGTPHTDALHLIERYHYIDPNSTKAEALQNEVGFRGRGDDVIDRTDKGPALKVDITVDDPGTFNMAWSGSVVYRRARGALLEDVCSDQRHDYITGKDTPVPEAKSSLFSGN